MNDPRGTREGLSVIPLGRRTYPDAKAKGESSMFEKAGRPKTIKGHARRGPDGMVKAKLPEPQWPFCKSTRLDTMVNVQLSQAIISRGSGLIRTRPRLAHQHAPEGQGWNHRPQGHEQGTYNRPERHSCTKCGIA
jgi:hypothetical protein